MKISQRTLKVGNKAVATTQWTEGRYLRQKSAVQIKT